MDEQKLEWIEDPEYKCWDLYFHEVHLWIYRRQWYCDRGHYAADISGLRNIDVCDNFERYYMDLEVAKTEMLKWFQWRLERLRETKPKEYAELIGKPTPSKF